jgi:hypothetical protein
MLEAITWYLGKFVAELILYIIGLVLLVLLWAALVLPVNYSNWKHRRRQMALDEVRKDEYNPLMTESNQEISNEKASTRSRPPPNWEPPGS